MDKRTATIRNPTHLHTSSRRVFASPWPLLYILSLFTVTSSPCGSSWTAWGCALIGTGWVRRNLTRVFLHRWAATLLSLQSANPASFHQPSYCLRSSELMLPWCFLRHVFVKMTGYHVNRQLIFPALTEILSHLPEMTPTLHLAHIVKICLF